MSPWHLSARPTTGLPGSVKTVLSKSGSSRTTDSMRPAGARWCLAHSVSNPVKVPKRSWIEGQSPTSSSTLGEAWIWTIWVYRTVMARLRWLSLVLERRWLRALRLCGPDSSGGYFYTFQPFVGRYTPGIRVMRNGYTLTTYELRSAGTTPDYGVPQWTERLKPGFLGELISL